MAARSAHSVSGACVVLSSFPRAFQSECARGGAGPRTADSGHGTRAAAVVLSQTNSIWPATRTILRFLRLSVGLFQFIFSELPSRTHRPVHMSMWICFCSCTECSWSASFATRALRQRQSAGSTATGGFEMTAPRFFSTDSGLSVPSYVAWACARRRAATVTLMPLESQLLARRSERRLARPCRFCRALCPSLALGHAPRQLQLQAPQQLAEPPYGIPTTAHRNTHRYRWSKPQLPFTVTVAQSPPCCILSHP